MNSKKGLVLAMLYNVLDSFIGTVIDVCKSCYIVAVQDEIVFIKCKAGLSRNEKVLFSISSYTISTSGTLYTADVESVENVA